MLELSGAGNFWREEEKTTFNFEFLSLTFFENLGNFVNSLKIVIVFRL